VKQIALTFTVILLTTVSSVLSIALADNPPAILSQNSSHLMLTRATPSVLRSMLIEKEGTGVDLSIAYPDAVLVDYPKAGTSVGEGWNSFAERSTLGQCVEFKLVTASGQKAVVEVSRIEDKDMLRQETNLKIEASGKAKAKIFSAEQTAKAEFVRKSQVDSHSLSLLVKARVVNSLSYAGPPTPAKVSETTLLREMTVGLTPWASELWKGDRRKFYLICGDSFVSGIETGAELFALYNFSEKKASSSSSDSFLVSGSVSYKGFGARASVSRKKVEKTLQSRSVSSINYYHSAHRGLQIPISNEGVSESVRYLGNAISAHDSYPFRIKLTRYDSLPSVQALEVGELDKGPLFNEARAVNIMRLNSLVEKLEYVIENFEYYNSDQADDGPDHLDYLDDKRGKNVDYYKQLRTQIIKIVGQLEFEQERCSQKFEQFYVQDLQNAGEQSITKRNFHGEGLKYKPDGVAECLARADRRTAYWDYYYRALMPIHQDKIDRETRDEKFRAHAAQNLYDKQIGQVQARKNSFVAHVYKKCKKGTFGCGGIYGYDYIDEGCDRHPHHSACQGFEREIRRLRVEKETALNQVSAYREAMDRFNFWIKDTENYREQTAQIGGGLTDSELDLFLIEIMCQYGAIDLPKTQHFPKFTCSRSEIETAVFEGKTPILVYKLNHQRAIDRNRDAVQSIVKKINSLDKAREEVKVDIFKSVGLDLNSPSILDFLHTTVPTGPVFAESLGIVEGLLLDMELQNEEDWQVIDLAQQIANTKFNRNEVRSIRKALVATASSQKRERLRDERLVWEAEERNLLNLISQLEQFREASEELYVSRIDAAFLEDSLYEPTDELLEGWARVKSIISLEDDFDVVIRSN